jgi:DNA-binding MarR family transcriptional regulator
MMQEFPALATPQQGFDANTATEFFGNLKVIPAEAQLNAQNKQLSNYPYKTPELSEHQKIILGELRRGDYSLGELKDVLNWTYPELDRQLQSLVDLGMVGHYFNPHMMWRLIAR